MTQSIPHGIKSERIGAIALWTIDRPDRRNALARATVRELGRLARAAHQDRSLRAVVLSATGEQAFCAGADLKERRDMSEEDVRDFLSLYQASFGAIDRMGKPVVAAINGAALGGGLELALACDLRVLSAQAVVGLPETTLAIIPGAGGTQRLVRAVGHSRATELILTGRRIDANEAQRIGLVHRVASDAADARAVALELAQGFEAAAPIALAAALEAVDAAADLPLDAGLAVERAAYERTLTSADRLEALAAFREKRKPVYRGN